MAQIEITISPTGQVTINTKGFKGADCMKATAELERALGAVKNRKKKSEYFEKRHTTKQTAKV